MEVQGHSALAAWLAKKFQTFLSQNNNGNLESSHWSRNQENYLG
jgi:hypothetical protein